MAGLVMITESLGKPGATACLDLEARWQKVSEAEIRSLEWGVQALFS